MNKVLFSIHKQTTRKQEVGTKKKKKSLLNDLNKFKRSFLFIQLFAVYTEQEII